MPMTSQEMIRFLKQHNFQIVSQNGSHIKMRNPITQRTVIVPNHARNLKKGLETGRFKIENVPNLEVYFMKKLFYPAIFHKAEEGGFWISFPDFPECMTQGDDMQQAYEMAVEALGLTISDCLAENQNLPLPTEPYKITLSQDDFCVIVEFDMLAYQKRTNNRAVKKTLSIPAWLNEEATSLGINFSQTLQDALLQKIEAR